LIFVINIIKGGIKKKMCNCKATEIILGVIILVFAMWDSTISWLPSGTVIIVAAALIVVHALGCKDLSCTPKPVKAKVKAKSKVKPKRKKKRK